MYISIISVSVFSLLISGEDVPRGSVPTAQNTILRMNKNIICKGLGWFGPLCQYKCRCARKVICDINGQCSRGRCQEGWFGPACQYVDLAYNRPEVKELTDGDDDTCVSDNKRDSVTIELKHFYPFTWMRIKVSNSDFLHSLTVLFRNDSSLSCINPKNSSVDDTTLDIHCDLNETVKYVTLTGEGVHYLCSVYISGGRNVALRQHSQQSSMYKVGGNFTSNKAVDGKTSSQLLNNSCSCTDVGRRSAHWNVTFSRPYNVIRYILYNRYSNQERLAGFMLEAFSESKMPVISYKDTTTSPQGVYTLISEGQTAPVKSVTISINNTENILTLCEVEVYGDSVCEPGQYGRECEYKCNCARNEACFVSTGGCPSGCADGFQGENCNKSCGSGSYGLNCTATCSPNCARSNFSERSCDHVDGTCLFGCEPGYKGSMCTSACEPGKFGERCNSTCSPFCDTGKVFNKSACHHISGHCPAGCFKDYTPPLCREVLLEGGELSVASLISAAVVATLVAIIVTAAVVIIWRKYRKKRTQNFMEQTQIYEVKSNDKGSNQDICDSELTASPSVTRATYELSREEILAFENNVYQNIGKGGKTRGIKPDSGKTRGIKPDSGKTRWVKPDSGKTRWVKPDSGKTRGIKPDSGKTRGIKPDSGKMSQYL